MSEKAGERCGLVAVRSYGDSSVTAIAINALKALQHRGQESWGLAIPGRPPFRRLGLVGEDLEDVKELLDGYASSTAMAHVRYSTVGASSISNAQPLDVGEFCIAHNGTICNVDDLTKLVKDHYILPSWATDTYVVGCRLRQHLKSNGGDWFSSFKKLHEELNGGYCFIFLTRAGDIYAVRDPKGFRPLCVGWHDETESYVVASESCALTAIGASLTRDVEPGEIIRLGSNGISSEVFAREEEHAHCSFEYTYFAHPSSVIDGVNVYMARKRLGKVLAELYDIRGDVVIPVPDSARPAALGFSEETGIPMEEGLMKDRYGKKGGLRSFIQPFQEQRIEINKAIIPVAETIKGKDVVVIDDSLVRGTSSSMMVKLLRRSGARKISFLSTFPPIRYPCFMGIDFPTQEELIAYRTSGDSRSIEEVNRKVGKAIGADFLGYNDQKPLCKAIGMPRNQLCSSCTTGDYACLRAKPEYSMRMKKV